ncbi:MAG: sigma-70 family RNA polymerase sigma factor [Bacteroidetes bacterium]|nr:MAG: sigma-70 family RNA polymerase sigma factor [Bacteroidota bacterium]
MKLEKQFTELVTGHTPPLKAFAMKLTRNPEAAEDLTQDTMLKALVNAEKFQSGTNIKAWLYTIMRNIFINNYRRAMKSGIFNDPTDDQYFINSSSITHRNDGESNLVMKDIEKAVQGLNDKLKVPFMMSYRGYKYDEIAQELQIPLGTVKVRIHNARKALMSKLEAYNPG